MSKTFKNATNSGTEVYVGEGINAYSVQLIIRNVGSGIGKAGIYLNSSDIPALALAILEAAGVEPGLHEDADFGSQEQIEYLTYGLKKHVEAQERITAEAEAQAKLEAEALELRNAFFAVERKSWDEITSGNSKNDWLRAARRAREINKENQ